MSDYILRVSLLSLASFFLTFTVGMLTAWMIWKRFRQQVRAWDDSYAKTFFLSIAAGPLLFAGFTLMFVVLPALLRFEPRNTDESTGKVLALLAGVGFLFAGILAGRAAMAFIGSWKFTNDCLDQAVSKKRMFGLPVYVVPQSDTVVMLTGLWNPKVIISKVVIESLDEDELQAVIQHELAHKKNWDLAAQWLLRIASLGISGMDASVQREWSLRAELNADRLSAITSSGVSLASALVKIAGMPGQATIPTVVAAHLVSTGEESILRLRVENLLRPSLMESRENSKPLALWFTAAALLLVMLSYQKPVMQWTLSMVELLAR